MKPLGPSLRVSTRVRLRLWGLGLGKSTWRAWLDQRVPGREGSNKDLLACRLHDDHIDDPYLLALACALEIEPEELRFSDPLEDRSQTLRENVSYLINSLPHGEKGQLAAELGVDRTTVTRWAKGESSPPPGTQARLASHFRLPPGTNLSQVPLFLELGPVSHQEKLAWLEDRLRDLSPSTLSELFPALQRLLAEP